MIWNMSERSNMSNSIILLVEDDPNDQILINRAIKKANILNPVHVLDDGEKAIQYLSGEGIYSDRTEYPLPILILLDLKMPKKSGLEVIEFVKDKPMIKRIPIVVLTSSKESTDVNKAFDLGVNSYLVKPVKFEDLVEIISNVGLYWILMNENPDVAEELF